MTNSEGKLKVVIEDAAPDEKARGAAAAEAVFKRAGVDPRVYFDALFKRDAGEDLTEAEDRALALGDEAERAAADACCAGWVRSTTSGSPLTGREDPTGQVWCDGRGQPALRSS